MAKKKTVALPKATAADIVRLGPQIATIKAQTPPKQWAQMVKAAHSKGYTLAGALSNNPDPLKERTQESLRKQATSQVALAYKPAEANLDSQDARLKAWDAKRAIDNKAYEAWVANETQKIDDQATAADKTIRDAAHAATAQTAAGWTSAQSGALASAASNQGTVSDPGQSNALNFAVPASTGIGQAANAEQRANDVTGVFAQSRPLMRAGILGGQAALSASAHADIQKQQLALIDGRAKLGIQKAADTVKNWTDLQSKEISKASSNRDYSTIVEQLNQSGAKIALGESELAAKVKSDALARGIKRAQLAQKTLNDEAARELQAAGVAISKGKADLNGDGKVDAKDGDLRQKYALQLKRTKPPADPDDPKDTKRDAATRKADGKIVQNVGRARVRFAQLREKRAQGSKVDIIQQMTKDGYDLATIQIARALLDHKGKLPAQTRKIARALGISDPSLLES